MALVSVKKLYQGLIVRLADFNRLILIAAAAALASMLPQRYDEKVIQCMHRLALRIMPNRIKRFADRYQALLGTQDQALSADQARRIAGNRVRVYLEIYWGRAVAISLRRSKYPIVELTGTEHLDAALRLGNGAILWRMRFTGAAPLNAALSSYDCPLVHLSRSDHLCGSDRRISRLVGKLLTYDEARFLKERVIMFQDRITGYFPRLKHALASNQVISIVGDFNWGRVRSKLPVGKLFLEIPSGAASLAYSTGAALLPCAAVRTAPFRYRVIISPNVATHQHMRFTKRAFRRVAIRRYFFLRNVTLEHYPESDTLL